MVQLPWKTVWQLLKKLNIELPLDLAIALLGKYPRDWKTYVHTETHTQVLAILAVGDGGGQGWVRLSPDWVHTSGHLLSRMQSH